MIRRLSGPLLLACAIAATAFGKIPWEDFKQRTLQALVELDTRAAARIAPAGANVVLPGKELVLSKMVVRYSGLSRTLTRERREVLDRWAIFHKYAPGYIERYEQEYLFFEGDRKYWLPVQKSLAVEMARDIKEGAKAELYVISGVGGLRNGKSWDWLILVQDYQLPPG